MLFRSYDTKNNKNACHGDSGGPVMRLYDDGSYAVTGIVNFAYGNNTGACENSGVANARVDYYLNWIKDSTDVEMYGVSDSPGDDYGPLGDIYPGEPLGPAELDDPVRPKEVGEDYVLGNCSTGPGTMSIAGLLGILAAFGRRRR